MSTPYERALVDRAELFVRTLDANAESRAIFERFGLKGDDRERGRRLVEQARMALAWTDGGVAWEFLEPTPERRAREAHAWYRDRRRRHLRACLRRAEAALGPSLGPLERVRELAGALAAAASPLVRWRDLDRLRADLARAVRGRPADAPPPKDSVLVELSGWYERWRLLAHRTLRQRPDLLALYGLVPGTPPPRLRGREGELRYGEKAAGKAGAP
jgi:hypothetical protein